MSHHTTLCVRLACRRRLGQGPSRRPGRPLRRGRRRHDRLRAEPPAGCRRLELDEPAVRRHPPRHRHARGLQRAAVRDRASARTRRSSCTATTTTGSRRGPTGSSSCTAIATSASSTAGASTGSTTACRSPPTSRRTRRPATSCPRPTSALRAFRDDILPRLGDPELALVDVRSPAEFNGEVIAPAGHERDGPARRAHPGRRQHPVGPDGPRGRHVQERRRAGRALRGQGRHARQGRHRLLPDRRALDHTWFVLHELLGYERSATTTAPGPSTAA